MKVAIYALAKNESANVQAWADSSREADVRVVTDTGSTDDTVQQLEAAGVQVVSGSPIPWRWDDAHNLSLMHVPADVDVAIRLDLDESLDPGWREALEADWKPGTTKLRYWYHWSDQVRFLCDRVHARDGYRWQGATHEGLVRWAGDEVQSRSDSLVIRHRRAPGKTHGSDLSLLRQAVRENPLDARMAWYLARELDSADDPDCIEAWQRYLRMAGGAPNERAYAFRALSLRLPEESSRLLFSAINESPREPEVYLAVAEKAWQMGDAVGALYWSRQAVACPAESQSHTSVPAAYGASPADLAFSAAWRLGLFPEAAMHAREAARREPNDERYAANATAIATMEEEPGPRAY